MRTFNKTTLMLGTLLSSALLATSAQAQITLGEDGELDNELIQDEIVVTGSRIQNANIIASSPVTTLDEGIFERRGVVDAVDVLNRLPSVVAAQNSNSSNGATGTSSINLRGLGTNRNLVLIDGVRLGPGTPTVSSADLNQVPTPLLDRVEIVTGGASAVYGSDAIAGVTNFVLRRDFNGAEINAQYGFYLDDNDNEFARDVLNASSTDGIAPRSTQLDGETFDVSAVIGTDFADGRGNIAAFGRYVDQNAVLQGTRDIGRCALLDLGRNPGPIAGGNASCLGSNFGPFPTTLTLPTILETNAAGDPLQFLANDMGMFVDAAGNVVDVANAVLAPAGAEFTRPRPLPGSTAGTVSLNDAGVIPRDPATGEIITGATNAYNFNPTNFYLRPVERLQGGFLSNFELNDNAELYLDGFFFRNTTDAQIAPSATFGEIQQVNCDNPFLTPELVDTICTSRGFGPTDLASVQINRRFVEGGGRNTLIELNNVRFKGGVRGDVGDSGFAYDVFGQYSETSQTRTNTNDGDINLLQEALLVSPDGTCTSGDPTCLPLNLFGTGPVDPEALASVLTPTINTGEVTQTILGATLQGEVAGFQSPFANTAAAILVGGEYRKDKLRSQPDSILIVGGSTGLGGPSNPVDGVSEVYEAFAEVGIALIEDMPFVENLSFTGQYRYSDYSFENGIAGGLQADGLSTDTYSAGLSWTPVDDLRIRGQYQRAVRAPNVFELFSPQSLALFDDEDPCTGPVPAAPLANCVASGLDPSLYGLVAEDAGQLQQLTGGSVVLQPEQSDTYTVGAVIRPAAITGLSLSVDYFNISVDDFIDSIPPQSILDGCLTGTPDPTFCNLITRDALGGLQVDGFVTATEQNIASREVEGIDGSVSYDFDLDNFGLGEVGGLRLDYNGTYYFGLENTPFPGEEAVDCVGNYGGACASVTGSLLAEYQHLASIGFTSNFGPTFDFTWRYIGGFDGLDGQTEDNFANSFGDENFFDAAVGFSAMDVADFRIGVNNVFDNDPPFGDFRFTNNGNTFPATYDSIGRYVFAGVKVKL